MMKFLLFNDPFDQYFPSYFRFRLKADQKYPKLHIQFYLFVFSLYSRLQLLSLSFYQSISMQSNLKESGFLKISLEQIKLRNISLTKAKLIVKLDQKPKQLDITFSDQIAHVMEYFISHANTNSILTFQIIDPKENKFIAECLFSINQFCKKPRVRHCVQVELSQCEIIKQKKEHIPVANLNCQLLFLKDKIGELEINLVDIQLNGSSQDPQVIVKLGGQQMRSNIQDSKKFLVDGDETILEILIKQGKQIGSNAEKIDIYEHNLLFPSREAIRRSYDFQLNGKKRARIILETRFSFHSLK